MHYSIKTEKSYTYWAKKYMRFRNPRHPGDMGVNEVSEFLSHLAVVDNVAAAT